MQCERYSAGLTSRPASSSTTFAPASHNCFVMTPPAAPEPITHTSYFTAAIPGIILERDLARVKKPPAARVKVNCLQVSDQHFAIVEREGHLFQRRHETGREADTGNTNGLRLWRVMTTAVDSCR